MPRAFAAPVEILGWHDHHGFAMLLDSPRTTAICCFDRPRYFALTGSHTPALKALRSAIERGYDPDLARSDPELASLRSLPEFERVLSASSGVRQ